MSKINHAQYYERSLFGRYITSDHIRNLIENHSKTFRIEVIGASVLKEDIHFIKIGTGTQRILMWSQMHGNESTTTKAVFDLLNALSDAENNVVEDILRRCTIGIIPMVSPDGARAYTRLNANQIDLNRDAQHLSQPESRVLRTCFESFKPHYCFNLHGQRTIFSAGMVRKSAIVSFLAPAQDSERSMTPTRQKAMDLIVGMNQYLQEEIPDQVGIYDDAFNINCVGDTFQALGIPTILFEAGHYPHDYKREKVRELIFYSLWIGLYDIAFHKIEGAQEEAYFKIPKNNKLFYDIIIRNARLRNEKDGVIKDIAVQYSEKLIQDQVSFVPEIVKISDLTQFFGHKEIDARDKIVSLGNNRELKEGIEIDFVYINNEMFSLLIENK